MCGVVGEEGGFSDLSGCAVVFVLFIYYYFLFVCLLFHFGVCVVCDLLTIRWKVYFIL